MYRTFCVTDGYRQANRMYCAGSEMKRISIVASPSIGRKYRVCRELQNGSYVVINLTFLLWAQLSDFSRVDRRVGKHEIMVGVGRNAELCGR